MHTFRKSILAIFIAVLSCVAQAKSANSMKIYSIDVEGGQSTLIVSPSGQTLLIDTGWPDKNGADRVLAITNELGIKKLDYVLITHFHHDHVGGVPDLV
ncbi:MAG TPA: MBL fold metallo-hydrolase, partial [Candidatus Kapabacteria bacterium]|nr:MBL fold metallo-hydrolase [Candidatus Kapabacteria bacterium]